MADARELWVWMNGERVGTWQRTRAGGHRFVYEASWLASARVRPLSLSLPITPDRTVTGPVVANFFDNLLPDADRIRRRVSARFKVGSTEVFDLLQAIGRDCVGAVQLLRPSSMGCGSSSTDGRRGFKAWPSRTAVMAEEHPVTTPKIFGRRLAIPAHRPATQCAAGPCQLFELSRTWRRER